MEDQKHKENQSQQASQTSPVPKQNRQRAEKFAHFHWYVCIQEMQLNVVQHLMLIS
jgi:hypothetical protein